MQVSFSGQFRTLRVVNGQFSLSPVARVSQLFCPLITSLLPPLRLCLVCDFHFAHQCNLARTRFLVTRNKSQISTTPVQASTRIPMIAVFTILDFLQGTCDVNWLVFL
jgi:hypothetical protein